MRSVQIFSSQLNDQTDSDFLIKELLLHVMNQDHSLNTFSNLNNNDAERLKRRSENVLTQTEFDTSSEPEVSPKHGYSKNPENLSSQPATHYSHLKFDADGEFSSVQKDTLHFNYAQSAYISFYTGTRPRQDPSVILTNFIHDPIQSFLKIPHPQWHFHRETNL